MAQLQEKSDSSSTRSSGHGVGHGLAATATTGRRASSAGNDHGLGPSRQASDWSDRDRATLRRLGKKPVLKRNFGFISILGFSSTILITWETVLTTLNFGLLNGGPAGLIGQYIFIWIGVTLSFVVITEMASMAPTSGGQYHWVSILAPPKIHDFVSYITGWLTVCGWQANTASGSVLAAQLLLGLATVANPDYDYKAWHLVLTSWAVTLFAVFINLRGGVALPRFEATMLLLHLFGFFAVIIPLVTLGPKQDSNFVFGDFYNGGGFPTNGLSFLVGVLGMLWTFSGADGAIHMSEEIENAPLVVPRSILTTYVMNGIFGFAMLVAILFATQDLEAALNSPTGYPFIQIYQSATGSSGGTIAVVALLAIMEICATTSSLASASRQFWAFSRDHGVPGWSLFVKIEKKSSVPIYAVGLTAVVSVLLVLINFGSNLVFQDLVSVAIAGLYSSYLLATSLLLYRRLTGGIRPYKSPAIARSVPGTSAGQQQQPAPASSHADPAGATLEEDASAVTTLNNAVGADLEWGPWHVPEPFGTVLNAFVCCFLLVAWFFSFWPSTWLVDAAAMNYNCLLWGAVVLASLAWYSIAGRKEYHGPIVELDRDEVVDGPGAMSGGGGVGLQVHQQQQQQQLQQARTKSH